MRVNSINSILIASKAAFGMPNLSNKAMPKDSFVSQITFGNSAGNNEQFKRIEAMLGRFEAREKAIIMEYLECESPNEGEDVVMPSVIKMLVNARDASEKKHRFNGKQVLAILETISKTDQKYVVETLDRLLDEKRPDGIYKYDTFTIRVSFATDGWTGVSGLQRAAVLTAMDSWFGQRVQGDIDKLMSMSTHDKDATPKTKALLDKARNEFGNPRFNMEEKNSILENIAPQYATTAINLLNVLLDAKDKDGKFRFNAANIRNNLSNVNDFNEDIVVDLTKILVDARGKDSKPRFNDRDIRLCMMNIHKYNNSIANNLMGALIDSKNKDGSYAFDSSSIASIFKAVNFKNQILVVPIIKILFSSENTNRRDIKPDEILNALGKITKRDKWEPPQDIIAKYI